jgi:hypothetical protein
VRQLAPLFGISPATVCRVLQRLGPLLAIPPACSTTRTPGSVATPRAGRVLQGTVRGYAGRLALEVPTRTMSRRNASPGCARGRSAVRAPDTVTSPAPRSPRPSRLSDTPPSPGPEQAPAPRARRSPRRRPRTGRRAATSRGQARQPKETKKTGETRETSPYRRSARSSALAYALVGALAATALTGHHEPAHHRQQHQWRDPNRPGRPSATIATDAATGHPPCSFQLARTINQPEPATPRTAEAVTLGPWFRKCLIRTQRSPGLNIDFQSPCQPDRPISRPSTRLPNMRYIQLDFTE